MSWKNYLTYLPLLLRMPPLLTLKLLVGTLTALVLAACGGGGGADSTSYTVDSGVAQKGPLMQGSQITINELSASTLQPSGRSFDFEVANNLGVFNPSGISFNSPYLATTAEGYYFNEVTGLPSGDVVFLRGISNVSSGADTTINVNVLSNFSKNRILNLATGKNLLNPATGVPITAAPLQFLTARAQAQAENLKAFYIYNSASLLTGTTVGGVAQPANFTALDLSKPNKPVPGPCGNGVCSNVVVNAPIPGNQILAAMSALVMTAGKDGDGVNTLLSQIEADFADDGLLNNSPKYAQSPQTRLCAAAASTDFAKVATNLNAFYGSSYMPTDLSQWVDTSGCVDQLINRYKYAGPSATSPVYAADSDDAGKCFSSTTGTLTKNGVTVNSATVKIALGDKVTMTLASVANASGFIQRSSPSSTGNCPTTIPTTGLVRVLKYSATAGYPLKTAIGNYLSSAGAWSLSISGTYQAKGVSYPVTGTGSQSKGQLSAMTFERVVALGSTLTTNASLIVNGQVSPLIQSTVEYYDSNYKFLGSSGAEYAVVTQSNEIPSVGRVNDSGVWYVANRYSTSAKTTLLGTGTATYAIASESTDSALVTLTLTNKDTAGLITYVGAIKFRLTTSGVVTRLSESGTSSSSNSTLVLNILYSPS